MLTEHHLLDSINEYFKKSYIDELILMALLVVIIEQCAQNSLRQSTVLYTFDNIKNFNKDCLNKYDIKFISYGDNELKIIFNCILTTDQEFELFDILF